ncbi:hypothetical protein WJX81_003878 [Elliptochloris bilobata]|uniref:Amino acid transporter transmembrane domain-containing protein n=1 Tax=Elliptochloris bilobata TaxID=381761 RepID=A0AAW1SIG2_9CHLO
MRLQSRTGCYSYEGIAEAVGGRVWKVVSQVSLLLLLFGTIIGDFALLADVGARAVRKLTPTPPEALVGYGGRGMMVLLALCPVLPLCLLRRMRSLETAATAGVAIVLALAGIICVEALRAGLPAIASGELPLWRLQGGGSDLPESFAVLGFAFYLQPCLLPLLAEMPPGAAGVRLMTAATRTVVLGVATVVYTIIGVFGAARYGAQTAGNILVNNWLGGVPEGVLDLAVGAYLSISIPPMLLAARYTLDVLASGEGAPFSRARHNAETLAIIVPTLAVALLFPSSAEKIFAVTGASAVCVVCYVIPVAMHLRLYLCDPGYQTLANAGTSPRALTEPLLPGSPPEALGASAIAAALRDSSVTSLELPGNAIRAGARSLAVMMASNTKLTSLDLSGNPCEVEDPESLAIIALAVHRNLLQAQDACMHGAPALATPPLRPLSTSPALRLSSLLHSRRSVHIREVPAETPSNTYRAVPVGTPGEGALRCGLWANGSAALGGRGIGGMPAGEAPADKENTPPLGPALDVVDVHYRLGAVEGALGAVEGELAELRGLGAKLECWRQQMDAASTQVATVLDLVEGDTGEFRRSLQQLAAEVEALRDHRVCAAPDPSHEGSDDSTQCADASTPDTQGPAAPAAGSNSASDALSEPRARAKGVRALAQRMAALEGALGGLAAAQQRAYGQVNQALAAVTRQLDGLQAVQQAQANAAFSQPARPSGDSFGQCSGAGWQPVAATAPVRGVADLLHAASPQSSVARSSGMTLEGHPLSPGSSLRTTYTDDSAPPSPEMLLPDDAHAAYWLDNEMYRCTPEAAVRPSQQAGTQTTPLNAPGGSTRLLA